MGPMGSGFGAMDDNNIITMEDDDLQEDIANTESGENWSVVPTKNVFEKQNSTGLLAIIET